MTAVAMTVNGALVGADIEPRTLLADFLRDTLRLTGTHIGCAQGVCGACTLLIDGRPQRSCITFAVACGGAAITTIEGHGDDPVMAGLREAFSAHHALQCGFCTPGMLATARDIVLRLGDVGEARIREELSGNLCRCTGYVGIVEAVQAVCSGRSPQSQMPRIMPTVALPKPTAASPQTARAARIHALPGSQLLEQRIPIRADPALVWTTLSDLRRVASCLPGAAIDTIEGDRVTGWMRVALGPIKASFRGEATVTSDDAARSGGMTGRGRDTGSAGEGELRWQVLQDGPSTSLIVVTCSWRLTGALAQFARAGIVQDIVSRLTATFAANLEASLTGASLPVAGQPPAKPLGLLALVWAILRARLPGGGRP